MVRQILFLLLCLPSALCYFISVDANAEECFYDTAKDGTKMTLLFEVAEGGFLDIDVKIGGPDGKVIYTGERESNGKYTFAAHMEGNYQYCFGNKMSTMTPKLVMFNLEMGEPAPNAVDNKDADEDHKLLAKSISDLSQQLAAIKHEQEFMEVRERVHRAINDNTNSRVVLWAFFEAAVLLIMVIGQVYYLKRFFEVRRVI